MSQVSITELIAGAISGHLVSFPTDTVPALATLPEKADLIFDVKQRSKDKPLILIAASTDDLWSFVQGSDSEIEIWRQVAQKYWPGALTLVLPSSAKVPSVMNPMNRTTIGIRVSNSPIARQILSHTGPMATSSANLSGKPALQTMAEISITFPKALTLRVTKEYEYMELLGSGLASTIAKWENKKSWQVLRQGQIEL